MKVSPDVYHRVRDWLAEGRVVHHVTCLNLGCLSSSWTPNTRANCPQCRSPFDWKNAKRVESTEDIEVAPTSPAHVTWDGVDLTLDSSTDELLVQAKPMWRPVVVPFIHDYEDPEFNYDAWLEKLLGDIDSGKWIEDNEEQLSYILLCNGIFLLPKTYLDYERTVLTPEGVWVEITTRIYPEITLHEMTEDRAIHFNVAAKTDPRMAHRTHIAEVKTQLGEHQYALAYKLVDRLCDKLELGRLKLETQPLLNVENLSTDDIELLLKEPIT